MPITTGFSVGGAVSTAAAKSFISSSVFLSCGGGESFTSLSVLLLPCPLSPTLLSPLGACGPSVLTSGPLPSLVASLPPFCPAAIALPPALRSASIFFISSCIIFIALLGSTKALIIASACALRTIASNFCLSVALSLNRSGITYA